MLVYHMIVRGSFHRGVLENPPLMTCPARNLRGSSHGNHVTEPLDPRRVDLVSKARNPLDHSHVKALCWAMICPIRLGFFYLLKYKKTDFKWRFSKKLDLTNTCDVISNSGAWSRIMNPTNGRIPNTARYV